MFSPNCTRFELSCRLKCRALNRGILSGPVRPPQTAILDPFQRSGFCLPLQLQCPEISSFVVYLSNLFCQGPIIVGLSGGLDGSRDELYGARRGLDQTLAIATADSFALTTGVFEDRQCQDRHV